MQHLFGRILKPLMDDLFVTEYISSLRVIPANHSQLQGKEKGQQIPDTFGLILKKLSRTRDLFGAFLKMSRDTWQLDSPKFIEAYEIWVTKLRQDCLRRQRLEHHIREKDCLFWLTPESQNQEGYQISSGKKIPRLGQQVKWPTPQQRDCTRETLVKRDRLPDIVRNGLLVQDSPSTDGKSQGLWITPQASMIGGSIEINKARMKRLKAEGRQTGGIQNLSQQTKGKLNPDWVEQLMGLEVGWTDLDC